MVTLRKLEAICERCGNPFPYMTSDPKRKPPRWCIICAKIERHISREESRRRLWKGRRRP